MLQTGLRFPGSRVPLPQPLDCGADSFRFLYVFKACCEAGQGSLAQCLPSVPDSVFYPQQQDEQKEESGALGSSHTEAGGLS